MLRSAIVAVLARATVAHLSQYLIMLPSNLTLPSRTRYRSQILLIFVPRVGSTFAVVLDLFSRQVIGWSMQPRMESELAINELLMAVWRRQPDEQVIIHSDQGSQFNSYEWQDFLKAHNLSASQSRRGNCHDNAVAESFFSYLNVNASVVKRI